MKRNLEPDRLLSVSPASARVACFDGWGCSLAWWANQFGTQARGATLTDAAFGRKTVTLNGDRLPGLGLRVVRYNVGGGGGGATLDGRGEKRSPKMPLFKDIRGFWRDDRSENPASASWDWSVDAGQRAVLKRAVKLGANRIEFFSDAPLWWMSANRSTAGSDDGGDNLRPGFEARHAAYLATVARYARERWGVPVAYVEPFNEPSAYWWKFPGGQEGCHFTGVTQDAVIRALRSRLDRESLHRVTVSASDENDVDTARRSWTGLSAAARKAVGKVNAHGYYGLEAYRGTGRARLRDTVRAEGKKLWMSEYGDPDGSGATLAETIVRDFTELQPDAWVYWQPFDSGGWGMVASNPGDDWIGNANRKYYVFAQFARHLSQGMAILESADSRAIVGYDRRAKKLAAIIYNPGSSAQRVRLDLSAFRRVRGSATGFATTMKPGGDVPDLRYQPISAPLLSAGKTLEYSVPPNSVVSVDIRGVY